MATRPDSEDVSTGKNDETFPWKGNATQDFSITSQELDEAVELREEWREGLEYETWGTDEWTAVRLAPTEEDAEKNSEASGDANLLHQSKEVVEELSTSGKYPFVREPVQEEPVVVSQGMSFVDALVPQLEKPLRSLKGEWTQMVYASENPDQVVLSDNGAEGFRASLFPAGNTEEPLNAGKITPEYLDGGGQYGQAHNSYMTALADQAVGRSFSTPGDVRNGELLIENSIEAYRPVNWGEAEQFVFEISGTLEEGPKVEVEWDIHVDYGDEMDEKALGYRETSMYTEGFEDLESVQEAYRRPDPFRAYMRAATEASLLPLKASTAAMESMTGD
ncbi:MAG: hypothetical protein ABEJ87_06005 [Candidatus Nanohalobium sp.]